MHNLFPPSVGISQVRGVVGILNENEGSISISELAEEAEEDVDDLLPLIEACELMGLATVKNSEITLTERGKKLANSGPYRVIRESIKKIEPFKTSVAAISHNNHTTAEIAGYLKAKGIVIDEVEEVNIALLRKMLRNWGVRSKMLAYDEPDDSWSVRIF